METATQILAICIMTIIFITAFAGVVVPVLPGPSIAAAGILAYKLIFPEGAISWNFVIIACAAAIFAQIADFFFSWIGAKRYGASWGGVLGSFVGLIVGILLSPTIIMLFLAPIAGAIIGELATGKNVRSSIKAGWGTFLGTMFATAIKFAIVISTAFAFYAALLIK